MKMSYKAIKLAELRHQGHLRIIALSDFSLVLPVPAKFSIFVRSSLTTESIKIITCWRTFIKAFNRMQPGANVTSTLKNTFSNAAIELFQFSSTFCPGMSPSTFLSSSFSMLINWTAFPEGTLLYFSPCALMSHFAVQCTSEHVFFFFLDQQM